MASAQALAKFDSEGIPMKWVTRATLMSVLVAGGTIAALSVWGDEPTVKEWRQRAEPLISRLPSHEQATTVAAGLRATATRWLGIDGATTTGAPQASFRLARLERGPITSAIAATGTVNAVVTVLVGSQVSGQIAEINADFNDEVTKGDILARIDPVPFELAVRQAEAELEVARSAVLIQRTGIERAQADIENAEAMLAMAGEQVAQARLVVEQAGRELERRTTLLQSGSGTAVDHERAQSAHDQALSQLATAEAEAEGRRAQLRSAETQIGAAEAQIVHAEAQGLKAEALLEQARAELERTIIRAPSDGTIIHRTVEEGQTVAASLQAPTLFTIAQDLRDMQVNVSVDETDIGQVRPGQKVLFTVDAYPNRSFEGEVAQIRKGSNVVQNVVTYSVIVATANPELLLLPGMTATVQIVTDMRQDVVRLPEIALRFRPPGVAQIGRTADGGRVWVAGRNGQPQAVSVRVGLSDGHVAELMDGEIEEGASVIIGMETGRPAAVPSGTGLGL